MVGSRSVFLLLLLLNTSLHISLSPKSDLSYICSECVYFLSQEI